MKTIQLPDPPFYGLDELADAWNCTVPRLHAYAELGEGDQRLVIEQYQVSGATVLGVSPEERRRFEGLRETDGPLTTKERESYESLLAAFVGLWGFTEYKPTTCFKDIAEAAASHGIPLLRSQDTYERIFKGVFAYLRSHGVKPKPKMDDRRAA